MCPKSRYRSRRSGPESDPAVEVGRRRSVHELGRHPFTEIVQDHVLREEVTRACGPRYRIEPHSFGLTHVCASILRGLDAPQWSGVAGRLDLGMWTGVSIGVPERLGDQITRVDARNPGEARAQSDTGTLGDQHDVRGAPAERFRPAAGERGRPYAQTVVTRPAD